MAKRKSNKHPKNFTDLTGKRFGRLTVVALHPERTKSGGCRWLCFCDCGNPFPKIIKTSHLVNKSIQSCNCLQRERARDTQTKHRMHDTREYRAWKSAKDRCFRPTFKGYKYYGGRGITMCERWRYDFVAFFEDMGHCPEGLTLERRDVDGDYEPSNCIWASQLQQARNKRTTAKITYQGESLSLPQLAERLKVNYWTLLRHYKAGKPLW